MNKSVETVKISFAEKKNSMGKIEAYNRFKRIISGIMLNWISKLVVRKDK